MSAIIEVFRRISVRSGDSNLLDYGSITTAQNPTTCAGTPILRPREITLAAGESKTIWKWEDDGDFALLFLECSGYAWIAQHVDLPTSESDLNPAGGTSSNWFKDAISCVAPRFYEGMAVPTVPSVANAAASAFHATTANGRRYELVVKNPADATADITVTYGWTL